MNASPFRPSRLLAALAICCALVIAVPTTAVALPAAPADTQSTEAQKKKVKVQAKLDKQKVKVNEKVKLHGRLDVDLTGRSADATSSEFVIVQALQAGAWVDLAAAPCRPNGSFKFNLSFSVSTQLTLRVYHPESTVYAAASSELFTLLVI
ncbi:hypothetical protein SAMN05421810_101645 [Amycolatopsis arida]|uniref:Uncharacterized protein n=1 Tax=Amycolatopsis arida TaxID=587909 RepID=A0A1I5LTK2_9PSEU|nr:hypothetical protein [Amycolatopsis arida]TDX93822.1 hypothetical protein CLV69_104278 [Amycolatopsis arida]SFP00106.1 hypothetical protein SAMN05421810_101645 [Amycolatopsis arida]